MRITLNKINSWQDCIDESASEFVLRAVVCAI